MMVRPHSPVSADPGTTIDIYKIVDRKGYYGASQSNMSSTVAADETGSFSVGVDVPDGHIVECDRNR